MGDNDYRHDSCPWRTEIWNKTSVDVPRARGGGVSTKRQFMISGV